MRCGSLKPSDDVLSGGFRLPILLQPTAGRTRAGCQGVSRCALGAGNWGVGRVGRPLPTHPLETSSEHFRNIGSRPSFAHALHTRPGRLFEGSARVCGAPAFRRGSSGSARQCAAWCGGIHCSRARRAVGVCARALAARALLRRACALVGRWGGLGATGAAANGALGSLCGPVRRQVWLVPWGLGKTHQTGLHRSSYNAG